MNRLLFLYPVFIALLLPPLRRWPRTTAVFSAAAAGLLALLIGMADQTTWEVAGQTLFFNANLRLLLMLAYLFCGLMFGLSWMWPLDGRTMSAIWLTLPLLTGALLLPPSAAALIMLLIAILPLSWLVQAHEPSATEAATGYLKLAVVGIGLLLISISLPFANQAAAAALLAIGTFLLLAGFPAAVWLQTAVLRLPPLALALLFGPIWLLLVKFTLQLLQGHGNLVLTTVFQNWLQASGVLTLLLGAVVALAARRFRGLLAALLILDNGVALLALSLLTVGGGQTAVLHQMVRLLTLLPIVLALNILEPTLTTPLLAENRGVGRKRPFAVALLGGGLLTLLGLPLTISFSSRWAVVAALSQAANAGGTLAGWLPLLLLVSIAVGLFALLRGFALLLDKTALTEPPAAEPLWIRALSVGLILISLLLAAFPQLLLTTAQQIF